MMPSILLSIPVGWTMVLDHHEKPLQLFPDALRDRFSELGSHSWVVWNMIVEWDS
jgi:hypothetical protein